MVQKLRLFMAAIGTGIAVPVTAEVVFVAPGDSYQGQGITLRANGKCYVLTPAHVAHLSERSDVPDLRVFGRGGKSSKATVEKVFDDPGASSQVDLAVLELADGGGVTCDEAAPEPRLIDKALGSASRSIVQRVSNRGQITNSEALIRSVGTTEINLTAGPAEDDELHQGDSGSIILVDKTPVAMLLSKGEQAKGSRYTAIRLDTALGLANSYFASQRTQAKTFRFRDFIIAKPTTLAPPARGARFDLPSFIVSLQDDLHSETDRLLAGTRGFPQIDNGGSTTASGNIALSIANIAYDVRNSCRAQRTKIFGLPTTTYAAGPGSVCQKGFEKVTQLVKVTFRLQGDIADAGGTRVNLLDQFTIVLPSLADQISLPLMSELSNRICVRTKAAVANLTGTPGTKGGGASSGTGLFGTGNSSEIVPDIENARMRTGC